MATNTIPTQLFTLLIMVAGSPLIRGQSGPVSPGVLTSPAWAKQANERIEKYRKGDLSIEVSDQKGKALKDAQVEVHPIRHAFRFGAAMRGTLVQGEPPADKDTRLARELFLQWFNAGTVENELKWTMWAADRERGLAAAAWLHARGLPVHGHCLVWPSWQRSPGMKELESNPEALRRAVLDHIRDEVGALRGKVASWDVVNEARSNRALLDVLGENALLEWFQAAREADPHARLFINDYGQLNGAPPKAAEAYEKQIAWLLEKGAPLDGIGLQAHLRTAVAPESLYATLERFARFQKPLLITEFDFAPPTADMQQAADYTRDFLTVMFSHPAVEGVTLWGFWEGAHYRPEAAIFMQDWTPRPSALAWYQLVRKDWWTEASGATDAKGEYQLRGFLGDYEITVKTGGKVMKKTVTLPKKGAVVTVKIE